MPQVIFQKELNILRWKPAHILRKRLIDPLNEELQKEDGAYRS